MGLGFTIKSNIETITNANHVMIGQRLGKDTHEVSNCIWQIMDASTWSNLLKEFAKSPIAEVRFPDMINNEWQVKQMYVQEQSAEVLSANENGLPSLYRNCTMTLVDTGR